MEGGIMRLCVWVSVFLRIYKKWNFFIINLTFLTDFFHLNKN